MTAVGNWMFTTFSARRGYRLGRQLCCSHVFALFIALFPTADTKNLAFHCPLLI